ncbi:LLM class flavin-dependent oxidoreductase [Pseudonocardia sp. NPDC049635]|uniref:LLM class flavin-dependent oxidoreductase n=1 Tax=Pseudonocardia sp. NPDC049635 TaxID=3155506 RepID=UPI0033C2F046
MRHGISLFPVLEPAEKSATDYYDESLRLVQLAESLGYRHAQIVEHYLGGYGGYSPDPATFLAAAAARTSEIRLLTGAAVPAFTHPVQLAGKLALLDTLSHGRVEVGFGRAFLPAEFAMFGVDIDTSRDRFVAGVLACRRLWSETDVVVDDGFHRFGPVTSLPRPVQRPHPPILLASAMSPQTGAWAGREGFGLQVVPTVTSREGLREVLGAYRTAWAEAGRDPAEARVQMKFTCYLDTDADRAITTAGELERNYVAKMSAVVADWSRTRTRAYAGYERLTEKVARYDFAAAHRDNKVLAGDPAGVLAQLRTIREWYGDVELSCVFNPGTLSEERAAAAVRLFAEQVVPALDGDREAVA